MNSTTDHIPLEDGHVCSECMLAPTERDIDEILAEYENTLSIADQISTSAVATRAKAFEKCRAQARQAIEAHYEKLISEAKPEKKKTVYPQTSFDDECENFEKLGYNRGIADYEANLLKGLDNE